MNIFRISCFAAGALAHTQIQTQIEIELKYETHQPVNPAAALNIHISFYFCSFSYEFGFLVLLSKPNSLMRYKFE